MERIHLEKAVEKLICSNCISLDTEWVTLLEAVGRVSAEDMYAVQANPPFNRSPLDGYAVRSQDVQRASTDNPVHLKVIGQVCAGTDTDLPVGRLQCVRIMTGAVMPMGSDCVIRQEDTDYGERTVAIYKGGKPHSNFVDIGDDYKKGELLVMKGTRLTAYHVGLLASNGTEKIKVLCKLKVGLLSTGDELIKPGIALEKAKIYDSNMYTLAARLKELGCILVCASTINDDVESGANYIQEYIEKVDVIVTTGGVSVGKKDIMHPIYKALDVRPLFWKLAMKPGTPALAGIYKETLILSLSGNPSAATVTFELLFRPLLEEITGCQAMGLKRVVAEFCDEYNKASPTRRFVKACCEQGKVQLTSGGQQSGGLLGMIGCNGLIDIPQGTPSVLKGAKVDVVLL